VKVSTDCAIIKDHITIVWFVVGYWTARGRLEEIAIDMVMSGEFVLALRCRWNRTSRQV